VSDQRPMARLLRIACFIAAPIAAAATIGVGPAAAQFFNPFEALFGTPPRPPSSVPGGRQPVPPQQGYPQYPDQRYPGPRYPEQQYPDQPYPGQARESPPVQSQPLPPPEGAAAAADPAPPPGGPLFGLPPGQRQPRGTPADTQPGDEVIAEPPSQKIANKSALFSGLDKITGRIIAFDAAVGETVQFGALQVTPRICYTRPPTETSNTDAFIEVDEVTLQGEIKRIFTGWIFASSPGLHAVEHPIYDVWLTDCKNPVVAAAPPPEAPPVAAPAPARPAAAAAPRRGSQQPAGQGAPQTADPRR
jgi:hypothetical protein